MVVVVLLNSGVVLYSTHTHIYIYSKTRYLHVNMSEQALIYHLFCFRALFVSFDFFVNVYFPSFLSSPLRLLSDMSVQMCVQMRERERKDDSRYFIMCSFLSSSFCLSFSSLFFFVFWRSNKSCMNFISMKRSCRL